MVVIFTCVSQLRQWCHSSSQFGLLLQFDDWISLSVPVAPLARELSRGSVICGELARGAVSGASPGAPFHWLALVGSVARTSPQFAPFQC